MISPDDTVLNISASSAETHVHTLKRKRRIHMLMRATKAKTTAKKSSFFFHGHRSLFAFHETSEHRQQSRISPSRARAARSSSTQISFTCIWTDWTREPPFPQKTPSACPLFWPKSYQQILSVDQLKDFIIIRESCFQLEEKCAHGCTNWNAMCFVMIVL